jgi:hypothetical protein
VTAVLRAPAFRLSVAYKTGPMDTPKVAVPRNNRCREVSQPVRVLPKQPAELDRHAARETNVGWGCMASSSLGLYGAFIEADACNGTSRDWCQERAVFSAA